MAKLVLSLEDKLSRLIGSQPNQELIKKIETLVEENLADALKSESPYIKGIAHRLRKK